MMQLKIAPNDLQSMAQDGSAILRSLQNRHLPIIDLLVREAIQNSLDATKEGKKTTSVDFQTDTFHSEQLAIHLSQVDSYLKEKYPGKQEYLAIIDKETCGLTGDYKSSDPKVLDDSNFHKLVFGIGKNQNKEGAGGSWGLGKTSFFRIGIGIVIYYTRIKKDNNQYEERLIASLIESPKEKERVLPKAERGIAWWGEYANDENNNIYPVTEGDKIKKILDIFQLDRYVNDETGTTIIIPYLNDHSDAEEEASITKSRKELIIQSIQRWYFPRILNENYSNVIGNSLLMCKVNEELLAPNINFEPIFNIYQKIFNSALLKKPLSDDIQVKEIKFKQNVMNNKAEEVGYLAFKEVTKEELNMTPPNNKLPGLLYLGSKDTSRIERNSSKVMAYSRMPGMVIEYDIDGKWTPSEAINEEGQLLLAYFVPNSFGILNKKYSEEGYKNLESYLRSTENSDHATWLDSAGIGIINRMRNYSAQALKDYYIDEDSNRKISATTGLSRKYGKKFMPPKKFGKTSTHKKDKEKSSRESSNKNRRSDIKLIKSTPINENMVEVSAKLFLKENTTSRVYLQVLTQDTHLDSEKWIKTVGDHIEFPFYFKNIEIKGLGVINNEEINVKIMPDEQNHSSLTVISTEDQDLEIDVNLIIGIYSDLYIPNISIKTIEDIEKVK